MQTKEQVQDKISEMMVDLEKAIAKRCDALLHSGGIDFNAFEDNYRLPKIILTAALADIGEATYSPNDPRDRRIVQNLRHF